MKKPKRPQPSIPRPAPITGDPLADADHQDRDTLAARPPVDVGVYAAATPARCYLCQGVVPAGLRRPWIGRSPLCEACTVEHGAGDLEALTASLEVVETWPQIRRSIHGRRLLTASRRWADDRLARFAATITAR